MASNGEVKDIHRKDSTKTLLKNEALYQYMLNTMVYPREHECMRELRLITQQHTYGFMVSPPDEGLLLSMLLKVMGARNHRGRRRHRLLRRHRARPPRRRPGRGHRRQPEVLRPRPARHPKSRRRAQGRLPRGTRAAHPRQAARRRGERGKFDFGSWTRTRGATTSS